jgi:CRP-like cAMP-binding protein
LPFFPLFSELSEDERAVIAEFVRPVEVSAGERVAKEGEFAYEFFVIESGKAEVRAQGQPIAEIGPGDFFGELGLLVTGRRTADIVATSPMTLIAIFDQDFRRLERTEQVFSERVRSVLLERLGKANMSTAAE